MNLGHRFGPFGWLGVLLCAMAVVVVTVMVLHSVQSGHGVRLADGPHRLVLPADTTYGIYVNDANNSGYSEKCSATDAQGNRVRMAPPPWSLSTSDTEMLDMVYNTGSGELTINCSVPGEVVTTRPVPTYWELLLGAMTAGVMAAAGIVLILTRLIHRWSVGSTPLATDGARL